MLLTTRPRDAVIWEEVTSTAPGHGAGWSQASKQILSSGAVNLILPEQNRGAPSSIPFSTLFWNYCPLNIGVWGLSQLQSRGPFLLLGGCVPCPPTLFSTHRQPRRRVATWARRGRKRRSESNWSPSPWEGTVRTVITSTRGMPVTCQALP